MEKIVRIVIETKRGIRIGYERIIKKSDPKKEIEPNPLKKLRRIDTYV